MRLLILFLISIIFSCSQQKNCSNFRTGTYKYSDPHYAGIVITRNDSIQIERDTVNNTEIVGAVEWVSDCRYILTYKDAVNLPLDKILGAQIDVNITETSYNSYKCTSTDASKSLTIELVKLD